MHDDFDNEYWAAMTNNYHFKFLLQLTGLSTDFESTAKLFRRHGWEVTKSKVKGWRTSLNNDRASPMPDAALAAFQQALFDLRDEATEVNIALFDCRDIFKEMDEQ